MSVQTRSRRRIYSRLISVVVRGSVSKLHSTALRQEWLQEIGSHLSQLGPCAKRIASIYCGKTTLLADDQLIKQRYFTCPVLKRVGPFGIYDCEPGPIYRNGFRTAVSTPAKDAPMHEGSSALASVGQPQAVISEHVVPEAANSNSSLQLLDTSLPCNATAQQTSAWLQNHRFSAYLRTFSSFSGADLLRLSRDDLIQICGLADGIRLFNALHTKAKTLYLCVQSVQASPIVYHAVYLASVSSREMITKLAKLLEITVSQIHDVYIQGPSGIHVLMTDELVHNIKDQALFTIEILRDRPSDRLRILLKPPSH